jgi:hypothetical protein
MEDLASVDTSVESIWNNIRLDGPINKQERLKQRVQSKLKR